MVIDRQQAVQVLQQWAAWDRRLPTGPWRAVERSDTDVNGPASFDADVDVDRNTFERHEQVRAQTAAWRGLVDGQGVPLVGQPLPGGRPVEVHDPVWRGLAELRTGLPQVLAVCRMLWRETAAAEAPLIVTGAGDGRGNPRHGLHLSEADLERAARACYEAGPNPLAYDDLPTALHAEWQARAAAAIEAVLP